MKHPEPLLITLFIIGQEDYNSSLESVGFEAKGWISSPNFHRKKGTFILFINQRFKKLMNGNFMSGTNNITQTHKQNTDSSKTPQSRKASKMCTKTISPSTPTLLSISPCLLTPKISMLTSIPPRMKSILSKRFVFVFSQQKTSAKFRGIPRKIW